MDWFNLANISHIGYIPGTTGSITDSLRLIGIAFLETFSDGVGEVLGVTNLDGFFSADFLVYLRVYLFTNSS